MNVQLGIIFWINYVYFHHLGRYQICAGSGGHFGVLKLHSGILGDTFIRYPNINLFLGILQRSIRSRLVSDHATHLLLLCNKYLPPPENLLSQVCSYLPVIDHPET